MESEDIFELRDVAAILHIPTTRLVNWSQGRTIHFKPSIREATRKGERNLYSRADLYTLALAEILLSSAGYPGATVQLMVNEAPQNIIGAGWFVIVWPTRGGPVISWRNQYSPDSKTLGSYAINLRHVREAVDADIQDYEQRRKRR